MREGTLISARNIKLIFQLILNHPNAFYIVFQNIILLLQKCKLKTIKTNVWQNKKYYNCVTVEPICILR